MDSADIATMTAIITVVVGAIMKPFVAFLHRDSAYYWPFLLLTLALGLGVHLLWLRGSLGQFRRAYFSRTLWWHPSVRADYRYYLVNGILYPLVFAPMVLSGLAVALWLRGLLGDALTGLAGPWGGLPRLIFTLLFFVLYDLGRFISHSMLHDVPVLWEFHKVHHSAEALIPLTASRVHPVDLLVMAFFPNLLTGLLLGLFQAVWGDDVGFHTVLGLHAIIFVFDAVGNLKHWQVPISYGRLEGVLISPVMHQVHHSRLPQHWGKNRGFELAIWDRLLGTYHRPQPGEATPFGLGDGSDGQWHRLDRMLLWPFKLLLTRPTPAAKRDQIPPSI